jgi:HEAT repeat protein
MLSSFETLRKEQKYQAMFINPSSLTTHRGTDPGIILPSSGRLIRTLSVLVRSAIVLAVSVQPPTAVRGQTSASDTGQRCREMLEQALQDKNPDMRKDAVEALSLMPASDSLFRSLIAMVDDRDVVVRTAAATSLGDVKSSSTIAVLKKALDDPVPEVSFAAARSLYRLHDPAGKSFLVAVVAGESKAASSYVTREGRSGLRLLHTPDKLFTLAAINAVGFVPLPGLGLAVSSAQGIVSEPDSSGRAAALLLIGKDRDPGLALVVESALSDQEWSVRAAAAHVAATQPYPALRDNLIVLLDDKKSPVRLRAAAAYLKLSGIPKAGERKPKPSK